MAVMRWNAVKATLTDQTGSARFASMLGLALVVPLVLLVANQLFTLASDAGSFTAPGASEVFDELPTLFYIVGLGAVGMASAALLGWLVTGLTSGRR